MSPRAVGYPFPPPMIDKPELNGWIEEVHRRVFGMGTEDQGDLDSLNINLELLTLGILPIDHTNVGEIENVGTNTHAQVDTHIADGTLHFLEGAIDHGNLNGLTDSVDHAYAFLHDGSRAMTGNLDLGDLNIINVGEIDLDLIRADAVNGSITVELDDAAGADLNVGNNDTLVVTGDTDKVGFGFSDPQSKVQVKQIADAPDNSQLSKYGLSVIMPLNANNWEVGIGFRISTSIAGQPAGAAITHERTGSSSQGKLHFKTSSTGFNTVTRMTIDKDGKVGIGTVTPVEKLTVNGSINLPKASGNGIKIDGVTSTFGWRDLRAEIRTRGVGATDPNDTAYIGNVKAYSFSVNDEAWIEFHIPHDYVAGTDIHLHFHWSHNSAIVTGGSITLGADVTYAKGHDQAAFSATVNPTLSPNASTTQYQHLVSELQLSASSPSATQIDTDDLEPDGLILARVYLSANNITSGGAVPDPFIHEVDVHYQSTNISTKDKVPDFYA